MEQSMETAQGLKVGAMPETSKWLRADLKAAGMGLSGVDEEARIIYGYIVAQEGPFLEMEPRGEFNDKGLRGIVKIMKASATGLRMRFGHPSTSSDSIGKHLGRSKNPRMSTTKAERDGKLVELKCVRADAHLAAAAANAPGHGDLAGYVMRLAKEDPTALASSLVIEPDEEFRLDNHGNPKVGEDGNPLPPLWYPKHLHASDLVDQGAACDGLLEAGINVDLLPDAIVRQASELLDRQFAGQPKATVRARCAAYLDRYLNWRYGGEEAPACEVCGQNAVCTTVDAIEDALHYQSMTKRWKPGDTHYYCEQHRLPPKETVRSTSPEYCRDRLRKAMGEKV